jgi:hydrogenase maturation protein HypF
VSTQSFVLRGLVQGQGVRPTIARLAIEQELAGFVCNTHDGVRIEVSGAEARIAQFVSSVRCLPDAELRMDSQRSSQAVHDEFRIRESLAEGTLSTVVPPDLGVCKACLDEVFSPSSRRYRYAFTTCTQCGPRYSLLHRMPFDRENTSMSPFSMCDECLLEYRDPNNRRFHSQTNACAACGPQCWSEDHASDITARGYDAIEWIGQRIRDGLIAAIKGVGGYQLVCDATNESAVRRLRERKRRPTKPLPIMVGDLSQAQPFAFISETERSALDAKSNPIVLLRSRRHERLASSIHPRLGDIGVMLPTSPLHRLLCSVVGRPIVVTSGNLHGAPLVYDSSLARSLDTGSLATIADVWLHHDREIVRPIDDSVIRCVEDREITLRCARGLAPLTFALPACDRSAANVWIGVGGHQKVAIAIAKQEHLVLGPHLGDMNGELVRQRFVDELARMTSLYQLDRPRFAVDSHPDYFTHQHASQKASSRHESTLDRTVTEVQHHHAHVAASMLEHGLEREKVLGFAFDGTGYGNDATVWGGEVLVCDELTAKRVAHLRTFQLPGGEAAIKQPWRVAMTLLKQCVSESVQADWFQRFGQTTVDNNFDYALSQGPVCSSMGRMFDAVAAMVFPHEAFHYEGEAAMVLEAACDESERSQYLFSLESGDAGDPVVIDWRPVVSAIAADCGVLSVGAIAMKFHRGVVMMMDEIANQHDSCVPIVCGGVFQNRVLLTLLQDVNVNRTEPFRMPGRVPVNDGGLSLGQLVNQVQRCV